MGFTILVALKALLYLLAFAIGLLLGSAVAAIWLRLAARWLALGELDYLKAFKAAVISNFVVITFNFSIGFNQGLTMSMLAFQRASQRDGAGRWMEHAFAPEQLMDSFASPIVYTTIAGLLLTAAIFCRIIPSERSEGPLKFGDGLALAAFYFALSFACMVVLFLIAFVFSLGILHYYNILFR